VKVFISYRREDSAGYTGRLYDSLRARFGDDNVFLDLSGIDSGRKFADVIQGAIHTCDVLLAVIGPGWLTCVANGQRRLDDPGDLVRAEIVTAFTSAIDVIPVLVGGSAPPKAAALPPALQPLAALDAHDMNDERWTYDSDRLIHAIEKLARGRKPSRWPLSYLTGASLLLVALLIGGVVAWQKHPESSAVSVTTAAAPSGVSASNIAGDWRADVTYDWGAQYRERLSLTVDGSEVSGTASFLGIARGITTGTIDGDRIRFETRTQEVVGDSPSRDVIHRYRGRINGDAIAFTMQTEGGSSQVPTEFTAVRR
jgi:hypothetical protein